jgi:hypothetical protein
MQVHERAGLDLKHLGVPVYPGAVRENSDRNQLARFEFDLGDAHEEFSVTAAEYSTSDSSDRVLEFYRRHLPHWIIRTENEGCPRMEFTEGGYKRIVAIREEDGRTHIGVASFGEPGSN